MPRAELQEFFFDPLAALCEGDGFRSALPILRFYPELVRDASLWRQIEWARRIWIISGCIWRWYIRDNRGNRVCNQ
jgi:hypothetical protein